MEVVVDKVEQVALVQVVQVEPGVRDSYIAEGMELQELLLQQIEAVVVVEVLELVLMETMLLQGVMGQLL